QALSGIAKDLNKMSAKSAIKPLVPDEPQGALYKWVAILTGSKNALKGAGFFVGGLLLSWVGFQNSMFIMASVLAVVFICSMIWLEADMGKAKNKPKFSHIFSKSESVNILSAARMFLFGARDVWFVVALPVYLGSVFGWDHLWVGGFLASWVIAYGFVQGFAPRITGKAQGRVPDGSAALVWAGVLALITGGIAYGVQIGWQP
ncbi:MFS transporter, partial [Vibrio sp. Y176]|uniref:MFS transporter n=1 Tax=Vibrio sp. Y176 TaxID=3074704 RepID=UPI00296580CE